MMRMKEIKPSNFMKQYFENLDENNMTEKEKKSQFFKLYFITYKMNWIIKRKIEEYWSKNGIEFILKTDL